MSMLLSARRQAAKPGSAFEASLGIAVSNEKDLVWRTVLAWVVGLPLCLAMGAAARRFVVERKSWQAALAQLPAILGNRARNVRDAA